MNGGVRSASSSKVLYDILFAGAAWPLTEIAADPSTLVRQVALSTKGLKRAKGEAQLAR